MKHRAHVEWLALPRRNAGAEHSIVRLSVLVTVHGVRRVTAGFISGQKTGGVARRESRKLPESSDGGSKRTVIWGIRAKRILIVWLIFVLSCGIPLGAAAASYDATVYKLFHGFLLVTDVQCHGHDLTFSNSGSAVSHAAFDAWGSQHFNVHVVSHFDNQLEYADEIYPRTGANALTKCASAQRSFSTHVDGRLTSWTEGNAVGAFDLVTSTGATRHFGFLAGKEPTVNNHRVFCINGPNPDRACNALTAFITFNRTLVRVYYKVVDSPDGPSDEVTRIQTLLDATTK